jgi:hypothetical protein
MDPTHPPRPEQTERHGSVCFPAISSRARAPARGARGDKSVDRITIPMAGLCMNMFPASELRIAEVERGRSCNAIVPLAPGKSLSIGDSVLFALAHSLAGQEPCYVKGGDSVLVVLTAVIDLGADNSVTGESLCQITWNPLGHGTPPGTIAKRVVKPHSSHR